LANVFINYFLVGPANGSSGHMLWWSKRIFVSVAFGVISPGIAYLYLISF
jgi:hypothetical protein